MDSNLPFFAEPQSDEQDFGVVDLVGNTRPSIATTSNGTRSSVWCLARAYDDKTLSEL